MRPISLKEAKRKCAWVHGASFLAALLSPSGGIEDPGVSMHDRGVVGRVPARIRHVTEVGGPLSHPGILAREFGIPAVLGVGNATTLLRDGQTVTVDDTAGRVDVLA